MSHLTISLLGSFQVTLGEEPVVNFASNKVRALLAYLAVECHRPHSREKLAALLWPEHSDKEAKGNLRYALYNLRRAIGDERAAPPYLAIARDAIQFNCASDVWVDVGALSELLERPNPSMEDLEKGVSLYCGEFLEGFSLDDSFAYEEWILLKRERIARQVSDALRCLTTTYTERHDYEKALSHAWRRVELEPWQEQAHRQLMCLLALNGQRTVALAQYDVCRQVLAKELDVEPSRETVLLYEQIRDGVELEVEYAGAERQLPEYAVSASPQTSSALIEQTTPSAVQLLESRRAIRKRATLVVVGLAFFLLSAVAFLLLARQVWAPGAALNTAPAAGTSPEVQVVQGKLAYRCPDQSPQQLCVYETQNGNITQVTSQLNVQDVDVHLSWAPDGKQLIFSALPISDTRYLYRHHLYVINVDGSGLRQITSGDANDMMPAWSPDGEWIAFHRNCALWIAHPDGSAAQRLIPNAMGLCVTAPTWSPDSQRIVFLHDQISEGLPRVGRLKVFDRRKNDPQNVQVIYDFPQSPGVIKLMWSPDGRQIGCECDREGKDMPLLFDATGGGELAHTGPLPLSWRSDFWPQWGER